MAMYVRTANHICVHILHNQLVQVLLAYQQLINHVDQREEIFRVCLASSSI